MKNYAHKIGAVLYVIWGVLHVAFGATMLYTLSAEGGTSVLAIVGSAVPYADLPQNLDGIANAILGQHSWNLLWFGLFAIIVGVKMNWKNSRLGYWLNLGFVSAADIAFVIAILIPGYITLADGLAGPLLWIMAAIFSTIGIRQGEAMTG